MDYDCRRSERAVGDSTRKKLRFLGAGSGTGKYQGVSARPPDLDF